MNPEELPSRTYNLRSSKNQRKREATKKMDRWSSRNFRKARHYNTPGDKNGTKPPESSPHDAERQKRKKKIKVK